MAGASQHVHPVPRDETHERVRLIAPSRLRWLHAELEEWQREGIVGEQGAAAIRTRYVGATRPVLLRIVVGLGAAFLAVGLLWLVATNLDQFAPPVRLGAVAALWLALAVLAQLLDGRARPSAAPQAAHEGEPDNGMRPTLASVCRLLTAAAFGAVIFQAAQSLQVPAYEPRLVAAWALGALVYAYATFSQGALGVGLLAAAAWLGWFTGESAGSLAGGLVMVLAGGLLATAIAMLHVAGSVRRSEAFALQWRLLGAALSLIGLFAAALPIPSTDALHWPAELTVLLAAAGVAFVAALALAATRGGTSRTGPIGELLVAVLILAAGGGLVLWRVRLPMSAGSADVSGEQWALTGAAVLVFIGAAAWFAVLGARLEFAPLTALALGGLVVFTTVQSFAVFAPIVSGATLFLGVGAIMVASGLIVERVGRRLHQGRPRRRFGGWRSGRHGGHAGSATRTGGTT